jgi:hypothetical protein
VLRSGELSELARPSAPERTITQITVAHTNARREQEEPRRDDVETHGRDHGEQQTVARDAVDQPAAEAGREGDPGVEMIARTVLVTRMGRARVSAHVPEAPGAQGDQHPARDVLAVLAQELELQKVADAEQDQRHEGDCQCVAQTPAQPDAPRAGPRLGTQHQERHDMVRSERDMSGAGQTARHEHRDRFHARSAPSFPVRCGAEGYPERADPLDQRGTSLPCSLPPNQS